MLRILEATLLSVLLALSACNGDEPDRNPGGGAGGSGNTGNTGNNGGSGNTGNTGNNGGSGNTGNVGGVDPGAGFGDVYAGQYNLGPVDWEETQWHNACAPYDPAMQLAEGVVLAGLQTGHMDGGRLCDACVLITADNGNMINARVVTYGDTGPNDIDLSPAACTGLSGVPDCNVWPRNMSWQFAKCPDTGNIAYQFQTGANVWWTSFWTRNQRLPIVTVEVQSTNHAQWTALGWGGDGTITDGGGFGDGQFSIRLTAVDSQQLTDTFPSFTPGGLLQSSGQFQ
jgi:expansin